MSSSESEKDTIQNGDMFRNKKAEAIKKKPEKAKKTSKADSKKSAKDWTEEETTMLIEILESKPCLWDVHHAEYSKRDIKEILMESVLMSVQMQNFILSKSRILIKISSKHKHSILMKKFDAFAPALIVFFLIGWFWHWQSVTYQIFG